MAMSCVWQCWTNPIPPPTAKDNFGNRKNKGLVGIEPAACVFLGEHIHSQVPYPLYFPNPLIPLRKFDSIEKNLQTFWSPCATNMHYGTNSDFGMNENPIK